ncbi:MAG: hypothetical protein ACLGIS_19350, partial [Actinomycetes bacterium]
VDRRMVLVLDNAATPRQVLPLLPAQGGFVELELPEPGHYPFVSHVMVDAERGAHGVLEVSPAAQRTRSTRVSSHTGSSDS